MSFIKRILLVMGAFMLLLIGVALSPLAFIATVQVIGGPTKYLRNVAVSLDQTANALTGGDPDETISSRMGKRVRAGKRGISYAVCRLLHRGDPGHCDKSIELDEGEDKVLK